MWSTWARCIIYKLIIAWEIYIWNFRRWHFFFRCRYNKYTTTNNKPGHFVLLLKVISICLLNLCVCFFILFFCLTTLLLVLTIFFRLFMIRGTIFINSNLFLITGLFFSVSRSLCVCMNLLKWDLWPDLNGII